MSIPAVHLKLVSWDLCPYVQRAVILLNEKNAPFEVAYIDLANKPDWFLRISPRGKVPVLLVDGTPIFESQAICEYLDEVGPEPRLMPEDPIERARDRAFFAFAEDVFTANYLMQNATEVSAYEKAKVDLTQLLIRLAEELGERTWLSGKDSFGMADVAFAPVFARLRLAVEIGAYAIPTELERVNAWGDRILARESMKRSIPADFAKRAVARLRSRGAVMVTDTATGGGARPGTREGY